MGVGEVLDAAINLYFLNLRRLLPLAAVIVLPVTALLIGLDLIAIQEAPIFDPGTGLLQVGGENVRFVDRSLFNGIAIIEVGVNVLAYLVIVGATFRAVSQLYLGGEPEPGQSLRFAARKMHSLLWLSLLMVLGVAAALVALVIPGILLLVAWSVAVPALMVEDARGTKALGRSFRLVEKNWWRTFGALLVGLLFVGLFEFLLGLVAGFADGLAVDNLELWVVVVNAISALAMIVTAPLQAAIVTVIYFNLRVRKEGFDVQLMAQAIEGPPPQAPVAAPAAGTVPAGTSVPPPTVS